jgi:hypothetical protein
MISKQDDKRGKYGCGCECDRCKRLAAYHSEMNNDIMVAPETAYIVGAFFQKYVLPPNFAVTAQDIPRTQALEALREGCTKQEERFLRHMVGYQLQVDAVGKGDGMEDVPETSEYTPSRLRRCGSRLLPLLAVAASALAQSASPSRRGPETPSRPFLLPIPPPQMCRSTLAALHDAGTTYVAFAHSAFFPSLPTLQAPYFSRLPCAGVQSSEPTRLAIGACQLNFPTPPLHPIEAWQMHHSRTPMEYLVLQIATTIMILCSICWQH